MTLTLADIVDAKSRLPGHLLFVPCPESFRWPRPAAQLTIVSSTILQRTGSFKERGARNAELLLLSTQTAHGASSRPRPAIMRWAWPITAGCWAFRSGW